MNRDLSPTKEAVAAMWLYGSEYAAQNGGSMTFWDNLAPHKQEMCREMVDRILAASQRSDAQENVRGGVTDDH